MSTHEDGRALFFLVPAQGGNYLAKVPAFTAAHRGSLCPGTLRVLNVAHDQTCLIWRVGFCSCAPALSLGPEVAAPPEDAA